MHTRNSQAMAHIGIEEVQMAHSKQFGCTVAAIDMALGRTRDMIPLVSQLTRDNDIIMLCNTRYQDVHRELAFLPEEWNKINLVDSVLAQGKWIDLSDVMLYKTGHHVMTLTWRELRRTPLERSMRMAQGALIWCPGLVEDDKYTRMGPTRHADWKTFDVK
jgi:hypothetical protein